MAIYSLLVAVALVGIALKFIYQAFFSPLAKFPGPFLAKFTNAWRLWQSYKGTFHLKGTELSERYGKIVRVGPNVLMISNIPEIVDEVYGFGPKAFEKSDMNKPWQATLNGKTVPSIASEQDKRVHAQLKKPIAGVYSNTNILSFEPAVDDTIRLFLRRLDEEFIQGEKKGKNCEIHHWLQYFAFDVVGQMTISRRFGFLEEGRDIEGMLATVTRFINYRAIVGNMPWLDKLLLKNPIYLRFFTPTNPFLRRSRELMTSRLQEPPSERALHSQDFVSRFLDAQQKHADIVTPPIVAGYITTNFFAGSDTTAIALRSIVYYTLKNPGVKQKLLKEIDETVTTFPVSYTVAQKMKYLNAVISEGLRIHPGGALVLERVVPPEGLVLPDGTEIPGGTTVGSNPWLLHFNKDFYGEDADKFVPERWLQQDNETEEEFQTRVTRLRHFDFGFGHGSRGCLGKHIALLEIVKAIPTLFGLLDMKLANPDKDWTVHGPFFSSQSDMDVVLKWRDGVDGNRAMLAKGN